MKIQKIFALILIVLFICTSTAMADEIHWVRKNETLFKIAQKYGVTLEELINKNGFLRNPNNLYPYQVIIVPDKPTKGFFYQVQQGDTVYKISHKFGVSARDIITVNGLQWPHYIFPGQKLFIVKNDTVSAKPQPLRRTYNPFPNYKETYFVSGPVNTNRVALTFDDGPDAVYTGRILDILKRSNVKATFFLMGKRVNKYPGIAARIIREGHVAGNHSWSHPIFTRLTPDRLYGEVKATENAIYRATGVRTALVRPPYGEVSEDVLSKLKQMNYRAVKWNVDSQDWRSTADAEQIILNTLKDVRPGAVVLFHSAGGTGQKLDATLKALPDIIYTLRVQGYSFVTVDRLLSIPANK